MRLHRPLATLLLVLCAEAPARAAPDAGTLVRRALANRAAAASGRSADRFDAVIADLAAAAAAAPERDDVRLALAETLAWAGRYDEAVAAYALVTGRDANNATAWAGIARVRGWQGRWGDAGGLYERIARQLPTRPEGWLGKGEVAMVQGRLTDARRALAEAARLAPDDVDVIVHQAEVELWSREFKRSRLLLAEALRLDPGHEKARALMRIAQLRAAALRLEAGYSHAFIAGLDDWQAARLQLSYDAGPVTLHGRGEWLQRFGTTHWVAAAGALWTPAPRWGLFAEGSFTPSAVYLPGWSVKGGAFRGLTERTYLAIEYAFLGYAGNPVHLLRPTLSQQLPFASTVKLGLTGGLDGHGQTSGAASLELAVTPVPALELSAGISVGSEPTRFFSADGQVHDYQFVFRYPARLVWKIADIHALQLDYQHEVRAGTWSVDTVGLSLALRI